MKNEHFARERIGTYEPVKEIELVNVFEQIRYHHEYDEFLVRIHQR